MKDDKKEYLEELQNRVNNSQRVKEFLSGPVGKLIMDYWEAVEKGHSDPRTISDVSAEVALAEVKARKFILESIVAFRNYLLGLVDEGGHALAELRRLDRKEEIFLREDIKGRNSEVS